MTDGARYCNMNERVRILITSANVLYFLSYELSAYILHFAFTQRKNFTFVKCLKPKKRNKKKLQRTLELSCLFSSSGFPFGVLSLLFFTNLNNPMAIIEMMLKGTGIG